ncbi:MAG: hypothetical protein WC838_00720 [Candidatus Margulisiibacteriota bacterium]|jgi:hypothetical protein
MKKILLAILTLAILTVTVFAVPTQLTYSGRLLQNGALVNSALTMTFKIYDDPTSALTSDLLWATSNINVDVNQGIYSVVLDQVSPNVFSGDNAYLEVIIGAETLVPRTKVNSVGYALQAGAVSGLSNVMPSSGNVGIGSSSPAYRLIVNGANGYIASRVDSVDGSQLMIDGAAGQNSWLSFAEQNVLNKWAIGTRAGLGGNLVFGAGYPAAYSEKVTFLQNGYVGIGTPTPNTKLEVSGTVSANAVLANGNIGIGTVGPAGQLGISNGTGDTAGYANNQIALRTGGSVGNVVSLYMQNYRHTAGTDWQGIAWRLQHQVDGTKMAYIDFNPGFASMALSFGTNGYERMRIYSGGNVGIGPVGSAQLHVLGVTDNVALWVQASSSNAGLANTTSTGLYVDKRGSVGIGTATLTSKLTVDGGIAEIRSGYDLMIRNAANTWDMRLRQEANQLNVYSGGGGGAIASFVHGGNVGIGQPTPNAKLEVNGVVSSNGLMSNGNVGIGLSNPTVPLYVYKTGVSTAVPNVLSLAVFDGPLTSESGIMLGYRTDIIEGVIAPTQAQNSLGFYTYDSNWFQRMKIATNGFVGIGTSTPGNIGDGGNPSLLHIHGSSGANPYALLNLTSSLAGNNQTMGGISFGSTGISGSDQRTAIIASTKRDAITTAPKGDLAFYTANGATPSNPRLYIQPDGAIGIGTTVPGYKLDIDAGGDSIYGNNTTSLGLRVDGTFLKSGADYAEYFEVEGMVKVGDIAGLNAVSKKVRKYQNGDEYIGIFSSGLGIVGNGEKMYNSDHAVVGLLGQLEFDRAQVTVDGIVVKTKDGKRIGVLLNNGKVLIGR